MRFGRLSCLAFLAALLLLASGLAARADQRTGRALPPGVYVQDDRGGHSVNYSWVQGSEARFGWRELEPAPGLYDFDAIDQWLERLAAAGKRGAFGVVLRCEDEVVESAEGVATVQDACAPEWALEWDPVSVGGRTRLNYLDSRVQGTLENLVAALARRYAADTRLAFVEILPGFMGEASPCPLGLKVADKAEQCAAYQQHYGAGDGNAASAAWEMYVTWLMRTYTDRFRSAGGQTHVPLQAVFTGRFAAASEGGGLVETALGSGVGLHDTLLAPDFLGGERIERRCAQDWQPEDAGYSERIAAQSHWVPLERHWQVAPVSFQFDRWQLVPERNLGREEVVWWSILNALDKHASVVYAIQADLQWEKPWQFFVRYAGRTLATTPDAWIALRGPRPGWCADDGDYEWFIRRRPEANGGAGRAYAAGQPDGRVGDTWRGAFSRGTDIVNGQPSLYFDLDDAFMYGGERIVSVEVTYWDGTPDMAGLTWELGYDAAQVPGQVGGSVTLGGSDRWLVQPFILLDATFRNRLPDAAGEAGNDLRLTATGPGDVRFHMVRVQILADPSDLQTTRRPLATSTPPPPVGTVPEDAYVTATATAPITLPSSTPAITPDTSGASATPADGSHAELISTGLVSDIVRFQGRESGAHVHDTFVSAGQPEVAHPVANTLVLRGDGSTGDLFFFDLSDVPINARVSAAWLELSVLGRNGPHEMDVSVSQVLQSWRDTEANWRQGQDGVPWSTPGLQPGMDYADVPVATLPAPSMGLLQVPVTGLVQEWLLHPERNHGVVLRGQGENIAEYYLASSEWRKLDARPRLRLRLGGMAETPGVAVLAGPARTAVLGPEPTAATPPAPVVATPEVAPLPPGVVARVASVAPSAGSDGSIVDITVYVYEPTGESLACDWQAPVRLWAAAGQAPARPVGLGTRQMVTIDERTFPIWQFSNVDISSLQGQEPLLHLFARVDGMRTTHNVVTLGEQQGSNSPAPAQPQRGADIWPESVDASIEILWPHAAAPVQEAEKANLTVSLYAAGTRQIPPSTVAFLPWVRLHWSLNDGVDQAPVEPPVAQWRLVQTPWLNYYLWDFNNIDVSAARQPGTYINFWIEVEGMEYTSNVWSHGYGPRPQPQAPLPSTSCRLENETAEELIE